MGWYKRLIFDGFRRYNWKGRTIESFSSRSKAEGSIISQPIFRNSVLKNNVLNKNRIINPNFVVKRFYSKFQSQPIFRNSVLKNHVLTNNQIKSPNFVSKRLYSKLRCRRWYQNPWKLGFVGCGVVVPVYYWINLESVPYSKRRRFVIMSSSFEKKIVDAYFESYMSDEYQGKVLGSEHPDSIRVEKVGRELIEGLRKEIRRLGDDEDRDRLIALLDEYNWEFIVVDEPFNNALCFFGGKIVIFTGRLKHIENDFEIAVTLSHEVGHAVARHNAENMSSIMWWLLSPFPTHIHKTTSSHSLWHPISRRHELEADYIGLLISASAGYDPWKMLKAYKKLYIGSDVHSNLEVPSSHPNGKTRVELISQTKVMEEALAVYKEALKDKYKDLAVTSIFQKIMGSIF